MNADQTEFRTALLNPSANRPTGLTDGDGRAAGRRFDVYRNNVAVSLTEALETAFPVVRKLVGEQNFKTLAGVFLRQHPPTSPLMMFYGGELPAFLQSFKPTAQISYLPDVARLELALRESYHAADADPIDPALLQALPPDQLMATRLALAPSARLVRSHWPVHAIWRYNTEPDTPKPAMAAEDVIVLRQDLDPSPHLLAPGGGAFVSALLVGETLGAAHETALADTPDFDLSSTLALLIGTGAITALKD